MNNSRLTSLFDVIGSNHTSGSAGRIMANIDRLEFLASELITSQQESGRFIKKMPWPEPKDCAFRVVLPTQKQSLAMLGGTLYAEITKVLDFRISKSIPTSIVNIDQKIWMDDRQPTKEERREALEKCVLAESHGNRFNFIAVMNSEPIAGTVRLSPLTPHLAEDIFRRGLPAETWARVRSEASRSVNADRLLSGLLQPGCMTNPAPIQHQDTIFAFRPNQAVWTATFNKFSPDPMEVVQAIAVVEHCLNRQVDLKTPLLSFKEKILKVMADGSIRNAWLNFDDDLWE